MSSSAFPSTLTGRVLEYQKKGIGYESLISTLAWHCYQYPVKRYRWSREDSSDFFLYFYPKLLRMVNDFSDIGKPFEHYLSSVLRSQVRVFARMKLAREMRWQMTRSEDFWERADAEETADAQQCVPATRLHGVAVADSSLGKRVLFAALKSVRTIGDREIERLAAFTGLEKEWIENVVSALKDELSHKERKLALLCERRNAAFCRARLAEARLSRETESQRIDELEDGLRKARRVMENAGNAISHLKLSPSNRQIAEAVGVPKGTVDSSLYWLKKALASLYNRSPAGAA